MEAGSRGPAAQAAANARQPTGKRTRYRVYARPDELLRADVKVPESLDDDDLVFLGKAEGYERGQAVGALLDAPITEKDGARGERLAKVGEHLDAGKRLVFVTISETAHGSVPVETEVKRARKIG